MKIVSECYFQILFLSNRLWTHHTLHYLIINNDFFSVYYENEKNTVDSTTLTITGTHFETKLP